MKLIDELNEMIEKFDRKRRLSISDLYDFGVSYQGSYSEYNGSYGEIAYIEDKIIDYIGKLPKKDRAYILEVYKENGIGDYYEFFE